MGGVGRRRIENPKISPSLRPVFGKNEELLVTFFIVSLSKVISNVLDSTTVSKTEQNLTGAQRRGSLTRRVSLTLKLNLSRMTRIANQPKFATPLMVLLLALIFATIFFPWPNYYTTYYPAWVGMLYSGISRSLYSVFSGLRRSYTYVNSHLFFRDFVQLRVYVENTIYTVYIAIFRFVSICV